MQPLSRRQFLAATLPLCVASLPAFAAGSPGEWVSLWDGKTLGDWQVTDFAGHGEVTVSGGELVLEAGLDLTGINLAKAPLEMGYELELEAMRVKGGDFFCGLTFPVGAARCTLVVGGWGGTVVGISSIDGQDASENASSQSRRFELGRWYRVGVRVEPGRLQAFLDGEKVVDVELAGRTIGMRLGEIELSCPLGIASFRTKSALRGIRYRVVS
jgi:hypothetical protein